MSFVGVLGASGVFGVEKIDSIGFVQVVLIHRSV